MTELQDIKKMESIYYQFIINNAAKSKCLNLEKYSITVTV